MDNKIVHAAPVPPFVTFVASAVPMVFDNSMSYYEALCALWKWLQDDVINVINNNATVTEEYIQLTKDMKEYMDNYFDNLDVQEEINNKLDQMAEDGTLQEIIADYIEAKVTWTFDNVAEMKASENLVNGSYARTLGFYAIGDDGGATYYISNTGTANEMDVIAIGSLYAHIVKHNEMNPKQFGAKTDGTNDDAVYIRQAINTLSTYGGTLNLLDNKTYILDSVPTGEDYFIGLKNKVNIVGKSVLKVKDNYGDYNFVFKITESLNDVTLKDFTINENSTNNALTANTGTEGYLRTTFRLIPDEYTIRNMVIDHLVFDDCCGVWQIEIEGDSDNVEVKDCIINYSTAVSPSYDRTSIYFGVKNGSIHGCKLYGNNKANTALELHGINNSAYDNYVEGYSNGIFIVNDSTSGSGNNENDLVYNNTLKVSKVGVYIWSSFARKTENIEIHNNTVEIPSGATGDNICGISMYDVMGDGGSIDNIEIKNNTIISKNTNLRIFRFLQSLSQSFTIGSLVIENNTISGNARECVYINSPTASKLSINKANISDNIFNISNTIDYAVFMIPRSNITNIYFERNDFSKITVNSQLFQIFGNADAALNIQILNNKIGDIALNKFINASEVNVRPLVKQVFPNLNLYTTSTPAYINNFQAISKSILSDTVKTCYKSGSGWYVEWRSATMPVHTPVLKGQTFNLTGDTTYLKRCGTKLGYIADHLASTGNHSIGDWVEEGLYVYQAKTNNSITSDLGTHTTDFTYVGEKATFKDLTIA